MDSPVQQHEEAIHRHEERDTNPRGILWFAISLILTIIVVLIGVRWLFLVFPTPSSEMAPPSSVFSSARVAPPGPRLQVQASQDLKRFREREEATLNSYGWIDRQAGIVRIPIQRAIDLLAQRGLPSHQQTAPKSGSK